jgi:serine/threonine protein kinase
MQPENILVAKGGKVLKLADFGSVRGVHSKPPYTEYISTRWYRPPECLLTEGYYGPKMDVWAAGCVIYEIISLKALFPGKNEADQIYKIHKVLGSPSLKEWLKLKKHGSRHTTKLDMKQFKGSGFVQNIPNATDDCISLLRKMLSYGAEDRITAADALSHRFFNDVVLPTARPAVTASSEVTNSSKKSNRSRVACNAHPHATDGESPLRKQHKNGPSPHKTQFLPNKDEQPKTHNSPAKLSPLGQARVEIRPELKKMPSQYVPPKKIAVSMPTTEKDSPGKSWKTPNSKLKAKRRNGPMFSTGKDDSPSKNWTTAIKPKVELPKIRGGKSLLNKSDVHARSFGVPLSQRSGAKYKYQQSNKSEAVRIKSTLSITGFPVAIDKGPREAQQIAQYPSIVDAHGYSSSFMRRRQRNKKVHASVVSSGYGSSSYAPAPTRKAKLQPHAGESSNASVSSKVSITTNQSRHHAPVSTRTRRAKIKNLVVSKFDQLKI